MDFQIQKSSLAMIADNDLRRKNINKSQAVILMGGLTSYRARATGGDFLAMTPHFFAKKVVLKLQ